LLAFVDAKIQKLGIRRKIAHGAALAATPHEPSRDGSTLGFISANGAENEGGEQRELDLSDGVFPAEIVVAPSKKSDEHGHRNPNHAYAPRPPDISWRLEDAPIKVNRW